MIEGCGSYGYENVCGRFNNSKNRFLPLDGHPEPPHHAFYDIWEACVRCRDARYWARLGEPIPCRIYYIAYPFEMNNSQIRDCLLGSE